MLITMMFAADILGVKYGRHGRYLRDHRILADARVKTAEIVLKRFAEAGINVPNNNKANRSTA